MFINFSITTKKIIAFFNKFYGLILSISYNYAKLNMLIMTNNKTIENENLIKLIKKQNI